MDIASLSRALRSGGLLTFTPREAGLLFPRTRAATLSLQLHQWERKAWVRRLKRGLYELAYPEPLAFPDLFLANRLYEPSYVSLETALSHYQIIPETAAQATSVTPKATRRFQNRHGLFTYSSVAPSAFAGYRLVTMQGFPVRIAEPEKAVIDRLYAALRRGERLDPRAERWDLRKIRGLDRGKLRAWAGKFGASRRRLQEAVDALL